MKINVFKDCYHSATDIVTGW